MPKTIKVRIALAVDEHGVWQAEGWHPKLNHRYKTSPTAELNESFRSTSEIFVVHWVDAVVEIPDSSTRTVVEGEVVATKVVDAMSDLETD